MSIPNTEHCASLMPLSCSAQFEDRFILPEACFGGQIQLISYIISSPRCVALMVSLMGTSAS